MQSIARQLIGCTWQASSHRQLREKPGFRIGALNPESRILNPGFCVPRRSRVCFNLLLSALFGALIPESRILNPGFHRLAASCEAGFEEGNLPAGPLAKFLVKEASFAHSFDPAISLGTCCFTGVKKVPDMRSCQVRPSLSTNAQKKPIMKAESDTK